MASNHVTHHFDLVKSKHIRAGNISVLEKRNIFFLIILKSYLNYVLLNYFTASIMDDDDEDKSISLTGFLFGNIDTKGELDEDFLDEVRCYCL